MALDAVIFDVDGTLLDTNAHHVEAWCRTFAEAGYRIPADRIEREVGKGGDLLVPAVLGETVAEREGAALRRRQGEHFTAIVEAGGLRPFPGVRELFDALRARGLRTAIATSSELAKLQAMERSVGIPLSELADVVVTKDDAEASKPAPDLVVAAVRKLGLGPAQCAMVGDTVYDAEACRAAGVVCLALRTWTRDDAALIRAGARAVWDDLAALLDDLDAALRRASPGGARLTPDLLERLMREALDAARTGMAAGEVPIGAVLARGDGTIVARAHNARRGTGIVHAHAEIVAFARAAGKLPSDADDAMLVSTLEPCVMCTGAALEVAVDTIVYGLRAPADSGSGRVLPPESADNRMPRIVGDVLAAESRALLEEWLASQANPEQAPFVRRVLAETAPRGRHAA